LFKVRTEWSLRDVVRVQCRDEVLELAQEMAGPGNSILSFYQAALSEVTSNLSEASRVKLEALGRKWDQKAPSLAQQNKYEPSDFSSKVTEYYLTRTFKELGDLALRVFSETVYKQLGMRVAIFGAYKDEDDRTTVTL